MLYVTCKTPCYVCQVYKGKRCAASLVLTPTAQFPQRVIRVFATVTSISKSQLSYGQYVLIRQPSTVVSLFSVILVTVTFSTFAFAFVAWRPIPVIHLATLSWHPPTVRNLAHVAIIFYELITMLRTVYELPNRLHGNDICNLSPVRASAFESPHMCFRLTVMSNLCHTNTILSGHIAVDGLYDVGNVIKSVYCDKVRL